jgi:hypothetical protein
MRIIISGGYMKKDIKALEEKLKKMTGENTLPRGEITSTSNTSKKFFDSAGFLKLAKEVKKIFEEDATTPHPVIKS